jgi:hypothetical protein
MQFFRSLALALLLTGACASTPGERGAQEAEKKPLGGGVVEFRLTYYDGRDLKARVLLGATVDPLVIHEEWLEGAEVGLRNVRACGKTELLEHIMADAWLVSGREPIVTIRPGYWYGANVSFNSLFSERQTGLGPDCFEAELMVWPRGVRTAATRPIRVERTDKPRAIPDGGTEPPRPPLSDGGAP